MIHTDNGSEFSTWFIHGYWKLGIKHRHDRVRKSNDQAHIERFNRTIQEECFDGIAHSITSFKNALPVYLHYYNFQRTHMNINFLTPLQVVRRS